MCSAGVSPHHGPLTWSWVVRDVCPTTPLRSPALAYWITLSQGSEKEWLHNQSPRLARSSWPRRHPFGFLGTAEHERLHLDIEARGGLLRSWRYSRWAGSPPCARNATRERVGSRARSRSKRLPASSGPIPDIPVIFPPGRARLATKPVPTGLLPRFMTMGIDGVASLAASTSGVDRATIIHRQAD